jgi:hypothetical protein
MLPQAFSSPDLSLRDFYLFPELKSRDKGYQFETLDSVQKAVTYARETLTETDFPSCHGACKIHWAKHVALGMLF